jgi:hypothetical protein
MEIWLVVEVVVDLLHLEVVVEETVVVVPVEMMLMVLMEFPTLVVEVEEDLNLLMVLHLDQVEKVLL